MGSKSGIRDNRQRGLPRTELTRLGLDACVLNTFSYDSSILMQVIIDSEAIQATQEV